MLRAVRLGIIDTMIDNGGGNKTEIILLSALLLISELRAA